VRSLRRDVDGTLAALQRIHEIGKALPLTAVRLSVE
jgi:hypothetical protein